MARRSEAQILADKAAHLADKAAQRDLLLTLAKNPLVIGLAALAANRAAYAAGLYKPFAKEAETSLLGGPVWFHLGQSLPLEQERYQKYELFIVTATVAWAASRALSGTVPSITRLIEGAA